MRPLCSVDSFQVRKSWVGPSKLRVSPSTKDLSGLVESTITINLLIGSPYMLLSIDENKVKDELARATPLYSVAALNIEIKIGEFPIPMVNASSAVMTLPPDLEKSTQRLIELRQRLIASGSKPLSADELERLIDETRGR